MKKIIATLFALAAVFSCQPSAPAAPAVTYTDGTYRAEEESFKNGWKYFVEVTVADGKISAVTWDATAEAGGPNKDQVSREGGYKMVEQGGAQAEWHDQADAVEAWLLANQSLSAPDAITGATITYSNFFALVAKELNVTP